jgi:glycosyltransferase involved in cell wall biosynthesis
VPERHYRVLFLSSHPIQYQAPLYSRLAAEPDLNLHVAYCSLKGAEAAVDPEFGVDVQWDVPLLDGYPWTHVPNRGSGRESFFGLFNPGLWKMIRRGKYDAVVSYVGYVRATFWIAWLAAKLSNAAFLFGTDSTSFAPRDGRAWKVTVKKYAWPLLFRLADQVLALSSAGLDFMRSLRIPADRLTLIPFVVENDWWKRESSQIDRDAVRASWGVSSSQAVVLYCAKLQPWKRPQDLLRAFAKAELRDAVLVFAGEGAIRSQLESEAVQLRVAQQVRFLGFVNQQQLPAVYTAADVFALPSQYDPCPVVVCEAMLCGLPVLLSDQIRGRFDLVRPGATGDIFPCGDVDALAASLRRLLADRAGLAALAANARARMETWSPREYVAATVDAVRVAVSRVGLDAASQPAAVTGAASQEVRHE